MPLSPGMSESRPQGEVANDSSAVAEFVVDSVGSV